MNVSLTPELERFVAERIASGLYRSGSEVVRAALRLLDQAEGEKPYYQEPPSRSVEAASDRENESPDSALAPAHREN